MIVALMVQWVVVTCQVNRSTFHFLLYPQWGLVRALGCELLSLHYNLEPTSTFTFRTVCQESSSGFAV